EDQYGGRPWRQVRPFPAAGGDRLRICLRNQGGWPSGWQGGRQGVAEPRFRAGHAGRLPDNLPAQITRATLFMNLSSSRFAVTADVASFTQGSRVNHLLTI